MTGLIDWAAGRARMVLAFIALSLLAGALAYGNLPKEGEPDIEIPALFISVPFPRHFGGGCRKAADQTHGNRAV